MVPGGGPSLDSERWITTEHPTQRNRRKPFLINNKELGREFRKQFLMGLRSLLRQGTLNLEGSVNWLQDEQQREVWLGKLKATKWNVFVEGPPHGNSKPAHVIKYLARYISGGPIADRRLISHVDDKVTFWARTKDRANKSQPFAVSGTEFVRRWTIHILPKGYTRSRSYGGFHCRKRKRYLALCRELLDINDQEATQPSERTAPPEPSLPTCKQCKVKMILVESSPRPSWRNIFEVTVYRESIYSPTLHIHFGKIPNAHPFPRDG